MIDIASIPIRDFTEPGTYRFISTAYITEPALDPLADSAEELEILEKFEGLTSGRRMAAVPLPSEVAREELLSESYGYGWTYVNAAFCYTRLTGNRFNGPERGAWYATYGSEAVETAQSEISWHLTRELEATGVFENITDYRELIAGFTSAFHDLSGCQSEDFLHADSSTGYPAGQLLAAELRHQDANGVLYPSVRHDGGHCLAAFRPSLVQNVRQGDTWRFEWKGERTPEIKRV